MTTTLPGTTIEVSEMRKGISRQLFDGIFAAGGITLSQVCTMTGLEPYLIQNWVKRGFVSSPVKRLYSREQFARIVIINMLREALDEFPNEPEILYMLAEALHRLGWQKHGRAIRKEDEDTGHYSDNIAGCCYRRRG